MAVSLFGVPRSGAAEESPTYLFWDINSLGVEPQTAQLIHEMLRSELSKMLGPLLVEREKYLPAELRATVEDTCGRGTSCLAEAGAALAVGRVVIGTISVLGEAYSLDLKVIDTRALAEAKRAKTTLSGERARMLEAMQQLVYDIVDPSQLRGSLFVDVNIEGAAVWVDGKQVGTTPLATPIAGLSAGEHILKLTSPMIQDYFTFFTVQPGKSAVVRVDTQQIEALQAQIAAAQDAIRIPLHKRWWFWAAVASGLGAAATTAYVVTRDNGTGAPSTTLGGVDFRRP